VAVIVLAVVGSVVPGLMIADIVHKRVRRARLKRLAREASLRKRLDGVGIQNPFPPAATPKLVEWPDRLSPAWQPQQMAVRIAATSLITATLTVSRGFCPTSGAVGVVYTSIVDEVRGNRTLESWEINIADLELITRKAAAWALEELDRKAVRA